MKCQPSLPFVICSFSFFFFFNIYLLAVLGLHCYTDFSLVETSWGHSQVVVQGHLIVVASLVVKHWLQVQGLQ